MSAGSIRLLQSTPCWLPQTQTWMFEQPRALPDEFENHVVAENPLPRSGVLQQPSGEAGF